jgi:hypothetical protein
MLILRQQQIDALKDEALKDFENRMVAHLTRFFPNETFRLGGVGMHETVLYGIGRAGSYGIVGERDICKYIDIMVLFGRDFDRDPDLPWASEILEDHSITEAGVRIDRLTKAAIEESQKRKDTKGGG